MNDTKINGVLNTAKPLINGLLVSYATNTAYPNDNGRYLMLSHNTFHGLIGYNYPNPECAFLMTNANSGRQLPWGFYSGVVKYVAATNL